MSPEQVGEFMADGFTVLTSAFEETVARDICRALSPRLGCDLDDPQTWPVPMIRLEELLSGDPFTRVLTDRFCTAVDQLAGAGRWVLRQEVGWWPITFPGFVASDGWHIDGDHAHQVWSAEQAVLALFCLSTVEPGGGGTLLAAGSHHVVADVLWGAHPSGVTNEELVPEARRRLDRRGWRIHEVVARAGDVVLAHPLLLHSPSSNRGDRPRVMAQPRYDMAAHKRVAGPDLTPVERVIAERRP